MARGIAQLPHVDEHSVIARADPERVWKALSGVLEASFNKPGAARAAALLGCADRAASGPRPLAVAATVPGFQVERAEAPRLLALNGSHRFSEYALIFRLDGLDAGRTRLRAETRAAFPGLHGRAYRALVIGTRAHVLVTRRLLGAVAARAERADG